VTTRFSIDEPLTALVLALYEASMAMVAITAAGACRLRHVWHAALGERLAVYPGGLRARIGGRPVIWLHAASVGELQGLRALLPSLRVRFTQQALVVSTQTRTARSVAEGLPEVDATVYFPLDARRVRRRALAALQPELFIFTETELWPGFLGECERRRIPCVLASGRVSAGSLRRYLWIRPLMRRALAAVHCCAQSASDAERLLALGAPVSRMTVAGSLKVEAPLDDGVREHVGRTLARVGIEGRVLVVGASTHDGEESALLRGFQRARAKAPDLRLLLAPRHPERFESVAALLEGEGHAWTRFSTIADRAAAGGVARSADGAMVPPIVLLDRIGVLRACFSRARLVFVGGTLVPIGGHNVLEPAVEGCPVLVGPYTEHVEPQIQALIAAGGALRVADGSSLGQTLAVLAEDPARLAAMGVEAARVAEGQRGALERHLEVIMAIMDSSRTGAQ
jgi:3-deoxy-D-manno-octulosonic-acid transferase